MSDNAPGKINITKGSYKFQPQHKNIPDKNLKLKFYFRLSTFCTDSNGSFVVVLITFLIIVFVIVFETTPLVEVVKLVFEK